MVLRKHISQLAPIDVTDIVGDAVLEVEANGTSRRISLFQIASHIAPGGIPSPADFTAEVAAIQEDVALLQAGYTETVAAAESAATAIQARIDAVAQRGIATQMAQYAVAARDGVETALLASEASSAAAEAAKTAAELARAQAQTAQTSAAGSASTATGAATVATTKASEASTSAAAASASAIIADTRAAASNASAIAAALSSSSAGSYSADATASATAASASEVSARLTAASLLPSDFQQDGKFWMVGYNGAPSAVPSMVADSFRSFATDSAIGRVLQLTGNGSAYVEQATIGAIRLQAGRTYRLRFRAKRISGAGVAIFGALGFNSSYVHISGVFAATQFTLTTSYADYEVQFSAATLLAGGAVYWRPYVQLDPSFGAETISLASTQIDDITESVAAAVSAAAAASSASTASTKRDEASVFAASAQGFATTATTQAGNSSASASTASTAASNALTYRDQSGAYAAASDTSRIAAGVQAGNAASSASAANSSRALADSASAMAIASATLAASLALDSINQNPSFSAWANSANPADNYTWWSDEAGTSAARVASSKGGYAVRFTTGGGQLGWAQDGSVTPAMGNGRLSPGWYVLEAEVVLVSGQLYGAGLYVGFHTSAAAYLADATINFATWPDSSGVAQGAGIAGKTYRYSKLVQITAATATRGVIHPMAGWTGFGTVAPKVLDYCTASVRPATEIEIARQTVLAPLVASVTENSGAIVDLEGRTAAYWSVTAVAGGRAKLAIYADANGGGGVDIEGDVHISGNLLVDGTIVSNKFLTDQGYDLRGAVPGTFGSRWGALTSGALTVSNGSDGATVSGSIVSFGTMSSLTTYHRFRVKGQCSSYVISPDFSTPTVGKLKLMVRINGGSWTATGLEIACSNLGNSPATTFSDLYLFSAFSGSAEFGFQMVTSGKSGAAYGQIELVEIEPWR